MNQAQSTTTYDVGRLSNSQLRNQLLREISCLERHLDRLKTSGHLSNQNTLETYKDMIASRKTLLSDLS